MEISKIFYSFFIEKDPVLYTFFLFSWQPSNTKEKNVYFNSSYLAEGLGEIKYSIISFFILLDILWPIRQVP